MLKILKNVNWIDFYPELAEKKELNISKISSINNIENNSLVFIDNLTEEIIEKLKYYSDCLLILNKQNYESALPLENRHAIIYTDNPKYAYAELLGKIIDIKSIRGELSFDKDFNIYSGKNVIIAPSAVIEPGVTICENSDIGANTYIMSGARIGPNVTIGENCIIRENCVIGGFGFGFAFDDNKPPVRLPHIGGVIIGNYVEIGAITTICSGTIEPTIIKNHVKIDDHVHIAHNCYIDEEALVIAAAEVSGSVKVGKKAWIAPNCSIRQKLKIGEKSLIGLGSVVIKDVPDYTTVVGNPAKIKPN